MILGTGEDDPHFIELVRRLIGNVLRLDPSAEVYVIRIDGWFDAKWRRFSGKIIGAVGAWNGELTVPPFHPHRVLSQAHWSANRALGKWEQTSAEPLHIEQTSAQNMHRMISRIASSAVFLWFSSGTAQSEQASVMLYRVNGTTVQTWHVSFKRGASWKVQRQRGISAQELKMLME